MTAPVSVFSLIVSQTADAIFDAMLQLAAAFGLPTTTWRTGDPTRTTIRADSTLWAQYDAIQATYAASGFLDTAVGPWLTLRAADVFGITREDATYATPSVTLVNAGGGVYDLEPGGLTLSSTTTGGTFVNQNAVSIPALSTVSGVLMIAQTAGSAGTVGVNAIDSIVAPPLIGVTVSASSASSGADEQSDEGLRAQCRATLGALSPDGPADAYEFVVRDSALTGVQGIARAFADGDADTGEVTVYAATLTAGISGPTVALLQAAVDQFATPLATNATVVSGTPVVLAFTTTGIPSGNQAAVEAALDSYLESVDMGATVGLSGAYAAIVDAIPALRLVPFTFTVPSADVALTAGHFPTRGVVTLT